MNKPMPRPMPLVPPVIVHKSYDVKLNINVNKTWREKVAALLRGLARVIDGRYSPGIYIATKPELPEETVMEAVKAGYQRMHDVLDLECQHALYDEVLKDARPKLFESNEEGRA